ncbi:hypothetical protein F8M41_011757 [Gigaspora margarita]|uniref:Uncharacterized protein n=1 Tax=Gigaspora margarita TaxID=4874 RepID=A0A8H4B455_GIGMA|nr:hypothetical protein F8M41_011757 [Gigaspora margarita]
MSENRNKPPTVLNNNSNKFNSNSLLNDIYSSKHVRVEDFNDFVEEFCNDFDKNLKGRINNNVSMISNDHISNFKLNFEVSTGSDCMNTINSFVECS